jgi:hypothetical protein
MSSPPPDRPGPLDLAVALILMKEAAGQAFHQCHGFEPQSRKRSRENYRKIGPDHSRNKRTGDNSVLFASRHCGSRGRSGVECGVGSRPAMVDRNRRCFAQRRAVSVVSWPKKVSAAQPVKFNPVRPFRDRCLRHHDFSAESGRVAGSNSLEPLTMNRISKIGLAAAPLALLAAAYFSWPSHAPAEQPQLIELDSKALSGLLTEFNRTAATLRVIVLLSPT